eukprot:bmy_20895T0
MTSHSQALRTQTPLCLPASSRCPSPAPLSTSPSAAGLSALRSDQCGVHRCPALPVKDIKEKPERQIRTREPDKLPSSTEPQQPPSALPARGSRRAVKSPQRSSTKIKEHKHPFALYGWGEKQTDTGSQKTHNSDCVFPARPSPGGLVLLGLSPEDTQTRGPHVWSHRAMTALALTPSLQPKAKRKEKKQKVQAVGILVKYQDPAFTEQTSEP